MIIEEGRASALKKVEKVLRRCLDHTDLMQARGKCTRRLALNAGMNVRFHLNHQMASQCFAGNALQTRKNNDYRGMI